MSSGSSRSLGPRCPRHAVSLRLTRSSTPSPTVAGSGLPSTRGSAREEVQLAGHQPASRTAGRHQGGDLAVDLGVDGVAEAQLEAGAEDVAHRGAVVGPAARRGDDVQAEGEPAGSQLLQLELEVVEVGAQGAPAVDDQEHVAVAVVGATLPASGPIGLDGVDALRPEVGLATVDHAGHLGQDAAYDVGLGPGAHPGDVGKPGQRGERAAAEVEHEELRLQRRRGQRHARDDGAQQRALAAARTTDDGDVTSRAGEVDREGVAALLARPVDGAERDHQSALCAPVRRDQPELGVLGEVAASARRGCRGRRAAAATPGGPAAPARPCGRPPPRGGCAPHPAGRPVRPRPPARGRPVRRPAPRRS